MVRKSILSPVVSIFYLFGHSVVMSYRKYILLVTPLLFSGLIHLSNSVGFPIPTTDEGTYLGRSINILEGFGPQDPYYGYDHPFFGQTVFGNSI